MRVRRILCVLGTLVLGTATGHEATLENDHIGNWLIGAYSNDQTGKLNHCGMSASYVGGTYIAMGSAFNWSMGFANPQGTLTPGASYDLTYSNDGGDDVARQEAWA